MPEPIEDDDRQLSRLPDGIPVERVPESAGTRNVLAIVVAATLALAVILVVVGGLIGRFPVGLVEDVLTVLAAPASAVAIYYFHRDH
jgi:hypothetical protein